MKNLFQRVFDGLVGVSLLLTLLLVAGLAQANGTSNTKIEIEQGGEQLLIKSGGTVLLSNGGAMSVNGTVTTSSVGAMSVATGGQMNIRGVTLFQLPVFIGNIGVASASAAVMAPYAGNVTSVNCATDTQAIDGNTSLYLRINGTQITAASVVGILSTTSAYQVTSGVTISGGTVGQGSTVEIQSDGTTTVTPKATCTIFITP